MIHVSEEFRALMEQRTDFQQSAVVTLADGRELALAAEDFTLTGNGCTEGLGSSGLPLGEAVSRAVTMELYNDDGRCAGYDFFGAVVDLYLSFPLSETVEKLDLGRYTVVTPETYGQTVIVTAQDDMYKADRPFSTEKPFPMTAWELLAEVCALADIPLRTARIPNGDFSVAAVPEDATCRQVIGWVALLAGGNARMDRQGYLEIVPYDFDFEGERHQLKNWIRLKADYGDITITGVQTTREAEGEDGRETETLLAGEEGYVLSVEDPLAAGQEEELLQYLAAALVGKRFRRFEGEHIAYPLAEFMDRAEIYDRQGNAFQTVLTDIDFSFYGPTALKNSAESAVRVGSSYQSPSSKAVVQARRMVDRQLSALDLAMEKLAEQVAKSSGFYSTAVEQEDGSTVWYLHDKPTLEESRAVMKLAAGVIGFSTDGGESWPFGFTVDGKMVMGIIQAEGVSAEWVHVGKQTVAEWMDEAERQSEKERSDLEVLSDSIASSVGAWKTAQEGTESRLSRLEQTAYQLEVEIERTEADHVTTSTGYTFNADGLDIHKSGEEIHNTIDNTGMYVKRAAGEAEEVMLQANAQGVTARDVTVKNFLIMGEHARFEEYPTARVACYYI